MADKVTVRLSSTAAAFVKGDVPKPEKLRAARGEVPLCASDLGNVLLFLSVDADVEVRAAAVKSLRDMPHDLQMTMARSPETHPKVMELLVRFHPANAALMQSMQPVPVADERPGDPAPSPAPMPEARPEESLDGHGDEGKVEDSDGGVR